MMKYGIWGRALMAAALVLSAGVASAADKKAANVPGSDKDLIAKVRHEVMMYPRYTIWDNVTFRVNNGTVDLMGDVSQPYKKSDIEKIVREIPGVVAVNDEVQVLPLSSMDDALRARVARAIYGDANFSRYAIEAHPSIHIIVDNGHVRLEGVVANKFDKNLAGIRASSAGLSFGPVVNNLQVENTRNRS